MDVLNGDRLYRAGRNTTLQTTLLVAIVVLMGNLNALVDLLLHPEIPYFDEEHIIVGGTTAFVSAVAFGVLLIYVRCLSRAVDTIRQLEGILPICSHCRKIRRSGEDPTKIESWQSVESYISEKTTTQFSHGICPECISTFYKEH